MPTGAILESVEVVRGEDQMLLLLKVEVAVHYPMFPSCPSEYASPSCIRGRQLQLYTSMSLSCGVHAVAGGKSSRVSDSCSLMVVR
eukprot:gene27731-36551_t